MTRDVPPLEPSRNVANTLRPLPRESSQQEIQRVPGEALISLRDIHVGFEDREVLQGISFDVAHGETKVLLGETGTGKTLIMKLAAGLIHPDSGHVLVMGHDVSEMPERELLNFRRSIGFVFQEGALFDSMTVADNVSFRLREEAMDETEIDARVREALRFVEMEDALEKFPADLSGGMRRRVSIARALVDRPPVVLYDSPTAGLDPVTSQTIITLILRGRDLQDVTALLATHRVQDAFGLANFCFDKASGRVRPLFGNGDRGGARSLAEREKAAESGKERNQKQPTNVLVLRDGKIYFEAPADELLRTKDEYLKKFLASAE
ncbi:MAG TPA: ATP-binding cassette domain-containing protein [Candidatus Acidoferrales bacterium]|nr:ATP-binding cassette domain-containing protein [Candidatus Acidoferrales bacterium]